MSVYKVGICGHYGGNKQFFDGQTVKTKAITKALSKIIGENQLVTIDTFGGAKALPRCLTKLVNMINKCENVIILPAQNSVKIFPRYLVFLNRFYKKRIHYVVIGGWLPKLLETSPQLRRTIKKLDGVYVETLTMKRRLEALGLENIVLLRNFKELEVVRSVELEQWSGGTLSLCVFSRIMEQKGIKDIIDVITDINKALNRVAFSLDIYGPIDAEYKETFRALEEHFPEYIKYNGVVPSDKSVDVLKKYYALVFPTKFYTEGIPGTIIDAYASGIPVISSRWESFQDVIDENITGIGYEFDNIGDLRNKLLAIYEDSSYLDSMRYNCVEKAKEYLPDLAIRPLIERIK